MIQRQSGDGQRENIALNEGGGQESPRVYERKLGDEVQIRDDDVRVGGPLLVADGGTQDALQAERDKQDARDGRYVYSGRHRDVVLWCSSFAAVEGEVQICRPCWRCRTGVLEAQQSTPKCAALLQA